MQAYDLLTNCSVISEKLHDPKAIVEELALIGITKPADIAEVQQYIIDIRPESDSDEDEFDENGFPKNS